MKKTLDKAALKKSIIKMRQRKAGGHSYLADAMRKKGK